MRTCDPAISPDCPGHEPSKERFGDCLTEALWVGSADGQTGNVDGFGVYVAMYSCPNAETLDPVMPDGPKVTVPAGTFCLITNDDQGNITRVDFPTDEALSEAFDRYEEAYSDYLDVREFAITSSTGRVGW